MGNEFRTFDDMRIFFNHTGVLLGLLFISGLDAEVFVLVDEDTKLDFRRLIVIVFCFVNGVVEGEDTILVLGS